MLALVELPKAGLTSVERAEIVAAKATRMVQAMKECGCRLNNAIMRHSLLGLVVIPELRISDEGLIDAPIVGQVWIWGRLVPSIADLFRG